MGCCARLVLSLLSCPHSKLSHAATTQSSCDPSRAAVHLSPLPQGWTATQLALLASTDISVRSAPPMLTLLLVGTLNGSLFM